MGPTDPASALARSAPARAFAVGLWLLMLGPTGCGACESERVDGPNPYARCNAASPPRSGLERIGKVGLRIEDRSLRLEGVSLPLKMAAFAGPGSGGPPTRELLAKLAESGAALALLLGDVGDATQTRENLMQALARLPFPTLVLAGGRDGAEAIDAAINSVDDGGERLVNVTALHSIRIGPHTFVPVGGAPSGRYARDDRACGFALDDLKELAEVLGPPAADAQRWLLAWHAPGGGGALAVARTAEGVDVGSADLAELARRVGAMGGLFAWPPVQVARARAGQGQRALAMGQAARDFRLVLPRIGGPALERSDESRVAPGFAMLRLSAQGSALEALVN